MKFEWDEHKNQINIQKHNIDFNDEYRIEQPDERFDYGEMRIKTVGKALKRLTTVVYTPRDEATRLISARLSNSKERNLYHQQFEKNDDN